METSLQPTEDIKQPETITDEERFMLWKLGLRMKAFLLLDIKMMVLSFEVESGDVLVSVDKGSKGYVIIVFRGKDHQRPSTIRPKNLLSKRKALARSIELQRHEVLLLVLWLFVDVLWEFNPYYIVD